MAELIQEQPVDTAQEQPADTRTDIQIDTSILTQQEKTTTSLCDKYDVHVFGADIGALENKREKEEELEQEKILTDVLTRRPKADREEAFQAVMEADTTAVVRKEYKTEEDMGPDFSMYAYVLLGVLLAGTVLFYIEKRRKDRRRHEADNYNYRQEDREVL